MIGWQSNSMRVVAMLQSDALRCKSMVKTRDVCLLVESSSLEPWTIRGKDKHSWRFVHQRWHLRLGLGLGWLHLLTCDDGDDLARTCPPDAHYLTFKRLLSPFHNNLVLNLHLSPCSAPPLGLVTLHPVRWQSRWWRTWP